MKNTYEYTNVYINMYMDHNYICPICQKDFTQLGNMKRHMSVVHDSKRQKEQYICTFCRKNFTRNDNMKRHIEKFHKEDKHEIIYQTLVSEIIGLKSKLEENTEKQRERDEVFQFKLEEQRERDEVLQSKLKENTEKLNLKIDEMKKNPTNQILNLICVSNHDNYLDMLTDRMGNFDQAIEYIKDCALSDLVGDCKLIEKIYMNQHNVLSFSRDRKKTTVYFHNESNQSCSETRDSFSRKIANNLQNSYLKSINHLINKNLELKRDPNKFLADYDIVTWNSHIYQLSDLTRQHKFFNQLRIPLRETF